MKFPKILFVLVVLLAVGINVVVVASSSSPNTASATSPIKEVSIKLVPVVNPFLVADNLHLAVEVNRQKLVAFRTTQILVQTVQAVSSARVTPVVSTQVLQPSVEPTYDSWQQEFWEDIEPYRQYGKRMLIVDGSAHAMGLWTSTITALDPDTCFGRSVRKFAGERVGPNPISLDNADVWKVLDAYPEVEARYAATIIIPNVCK